MAEKNVSAAGTHLPVSVKPRVRPPAISVLRGLATFGWNVVVSSRSTSLVPWMLSRYVETSVSVDGDEPLSILKLAPMPRIPAMSHTTLLHWGCSKHGCGTIGRDRAETLSFALV